MVQRLLKEFSTKFSFEYDAGPQKNKSILKDLECAHEYSIEDPDQLGRKYEEKVDYGVIQKIMKDDRVFFVLAGLGPCATKGCGWHLLQNWSQHVLDGEFVILLGFPLGYGPARLINRDTGKPD